jgi:hypothetical protein
VFNAAAGKSGITVSASRTLTGQSNPLIFKGMSMSMSAAPGSTHNRYIINNNDTYVRTSGCRIGSIINDFSPLIRLGSEHSAYSSENSIHIAAEGDDPNKAIISQGAGNTSSEMKNCIILNAVDAFQIDQPGTVLKLKHCTFFNIKSHAVTISSNNSSALIKNCIFICGSAPILNSSGFFSADIDYNLYNKPNINVSEGSYNLPRGSDPEFSDALSQNFHLRGNTPCRSMGIFLSDVNYDFAGRQRNDPPTIGAFEW